MALYSAMGVDEVLSGKEPTYPVNHLERKPMEEAKFLLKKIG